MSATDDDVQAAERLDRTADDCMHLIAGTDVTLHCDRASARRIDVGRDALTFRQGSAGDRNTGAVLRQGPGGTGADTLAASGDECDLSVQPA
jgi:hypothetical protein